MTAGDVADKRLQFGRHVLDLERGVLLADGAEVTLRPKTFAVLRHLAEHPGRLISKDEFFAAVWQGLAVTDDTLVQSIGELRRALGDDGASLIRTVPRRGYRLEATVTPAGAPSPSLETPTVAAPTPVAPLPVRTTLPRITRRTAALLAAVIVLIIAAGAALWIELAADERPVATAHAPIAVLPFLDQSDEAGRSYFADGLTQDVIAGLGRFSALTVMSWNAVLPYKERPASPAEVARKLAVRYLVEANLRSSAERLRVNAQLVDADGRVLWTGRFDEAVADLFALQDKMTTQIVGALAIRVTEREQRRVLEKPTESLEAYDLVLRARPALQRPTRANIVEARTLLRRAIQLDGNYAAAHSALGETFSLAVSMGWAEAPTSFLQRAEEMAGKALSLDEADVRARVIIGRIHIFHGRYDQARAELDRAIAANPSDAAAIAGRGSILMWRGETDAAVEALELAQRIDPELNTIDRFTLAVAYYLKGRYDDAIEQLRTNLRNAEGAHFSRVMLAAAQAQRGQVEEAARTATLVRRSDPTFEPESFGSKFLQPAHLEQLRAGLRKAGLYPAQAAEPATTGR